MTDWLKACIGFSFLKPQAENKGGEEKKEQCEHGPTYRQGENMERETCCQVLTQCNHTSLVLHAAPHCLIHHALFRASVLGLMVDSCGLYDSQQLGWWPHH